MFEGAARWLADSFPKIADPVYWTFAQHAQYERLKAMTDPTLPTPQPEALNINWTQVLNDLITYGPKIVQILPVLTQIITLVKQIEAAFTTPPTPPVA